MWQLLPFFYGNLAGKSSPLLYLSLSKIYCSSATSIAAGQTITLSSILESVPHLAPEVSPAEVINAGPVGLPHEAPSLVVLKILRSIWNTAISRAMFFSLAMACAAVPLTLGMEFLNSKTIAIESENGTIVDKDRHLDLCQPKSDGGILASSANLKEKTEIT